MRLALRETLAPSLALFASASTLLCCALPALLIALGAGAVMAGLATNVPGFIWLTAHKAELFAVAGLLIVVAFAMKWMNRNAPCPVNEKQARACGNLRRWGSVILAFAAIAYLVGAFFAFFAADLLL